MTHFIVEQAPVIPNSSRTLFSCKEEKFSSVFVAFFKKLGYLIGERLSLVNDCSFGNTFFLFFEDLKWFKTR